MIIEFNYIGAPNYTIKNKSSCMIDYKFFHSVFQFIEFLEITDKDKNVISKDTFVKLEHGYRCKAKVIPSSDIFFENIFGEISNKSTSIVLRSNGSKILGIGNLVDIEYSDEQKVKIVKNQKKPKVVSKGGKGKK